MPLGVVMAGTIMVVLDTTIVNVALHQIGVDLGAGDDVEWVVTAYLLAVCASQPATGLAGRPVRAQAGVPRVAGGVHGRLRAVRVCADPRRARSRSACCRVSAAVR